MKMFGNHHVHFSAFLHFTDVFKMFSRTCLFQKSPLEQFSEILMTQKCVHLFHPPTTKKFLFVNPRHFPPSNDVKKSFHLIVWEGTSINILAIKHEDRRGANNVANNDHVLILPFSNLNLKLELNISIDLLYIIIIIYIYIHNYIYIYTY